MLLRLAERRRGGSIVVLPVVAAMQLCSPGWPPHAAPFAPPALPRETLSAFLPDKLLLILHGAVSKSLPLRSLP